MKDPGRAGESWKWISWEKTLKSSLEEVCWQNGLTYFQSPFLWRNCCKTKTPGPKKEVAMVRHGLLVLCILRLWQSRKSEWGCSWYAAKNYGPGKKCSIRSPRQAGMPWLDALLTSTRITEHPLPQSALAALMGSWRPRLWGKDYSQRLVVRQTFQSWQVVWSPQQLSARTTDNEVPILVFTDGFLEHFLESALLV